MALTVIGGGLAPTRPGTATATPVPGTAPAAMTLAALGETTTPGARPADCGLMALKGGKPGIEGGSLKFSRDSQGIKRSLLPPLIIFGR